MSFKTIIALGLLILSSNAFELDKNIRQPCAFASKPEDHKPWDGQILSNLPENFSWGNVDGINYLSQTKNQHIPKYCGSCWAQSTVSAMSDRIAVMRKGAFPQITIAPQVILDYDLNDNGCHGGEPASAMDFIMKNGIVDESCSQYRSEGHEEKGSNTQPICQDCTPNSCSEITNHHTYTLESHGNLPYDEQAIMSEIMARGPVVCLVNSGPLTDETKYPFGFKGVFKSSDQGDINHAISVVGWGVTEDGTKYWNMRNSWGEYWADNGYIKVERGNNTVQIEKYCTYGVVKKTWDDEKYPVDHVTGAERSFTDKLKQQAV